MNINSVLRRFLSDLLVYSKNVKRTKRVKKIYSGLPGSISWDELNETCLRHFSLRLSSVSYQHLSAWKTTGAYRLFIKCTSGHEISLIYKESNYSEEEIPALVGLPVQIGLPEYVVYKENNAQLSDYLPHTYLVREVIPGKRFLFVFEDLANDYTRISQDRNLLLISQMLPRFHEAMDNWAKNINTQGLIHYGKNFSRSMQKYAWNNLSKYYENQQSPAIYQVLSQWDKIFNLYMEDEFHCAQPSHLIHGDLNFSNIHIHKTIPGKMKLVDWEWAGFGYCQCDIVSLVKGLSHSDEKQVIKTYLQSNLKPSRNGPEQMSQTDHNHHRKILWCKMERGMLDASFLAAQYLYSNHPSNFDLTLAVDSSIDRMYTAYKQLIS